jgi:hypothetical protein
VLRAQKAAVFLPDRVPAYITWDRYQRIQIQLRSNRAAWGGAPRAGTDRLDARRRRKRQHRSDWQTLPIVRKRSNTSNTRRIVALCLLIGITDASARILAIASAAGNLR